MIPSPTTPHRTAAAIALLACAACTDTAPLQPGDSGTRPAPPPPGGPTVVLQALDCTAAVTAGTVRCEAAAPDAGNVARLIVGGQGVYVTLASGGASYDAGTGQFTMDVTLQNLIEQAMGTTDGTTLDPAGVRVFFASGPSVSGGSGTASVVPDGFGFFLEAGQPYYQYDAVLEEDEVSAPKQWTFVVAPTVTHFGFRVYVSTPLQFPDGYVTLGGLMPGESAGPLPPGTEQVLAPVVKTAVGNVMPGETVVLDTSDPDCASVDASGAVTAVRAATCTITATAGARGGAVTVQVTGGLRTWTGATSADWDVGANWAAGYVPAVEDSVWIPAAPSNQPVLSQAVEVGGVTVEDGATLSLSSHTLTVQADVATGYTSESGIVAAGGELRLAGTGGVAGRVPAFRVTGDYTLDDDLYAIAPPRVDAGRLEVAAHQLQVSTH